MFDYTKEALVTDWADPTVHVPYSVAIEQDGEVQVHPAHLVTMTPDFVFVSDAVGGFQNLPTRSLRSVRVTIQKPPADYDALVDEYPNAYQPWDADPDTLLRHVHERRMTLAEVVRRQGRPPAHLIAKAREFGYDLADLLNSPEPEPDSSKARGIDRGTSRDYLVLVKPGAADPYQVLSRHRIEPESLYRIASWGFAATLTGGQVEEPSTVGGIALSEDPDVESIERDPHRLAPHFRVPQEHRVDGQYMVSIRRSGDPAIVAARAGVSPSSVYSDIKAFAADMTDAQVQAVRQDPDVLQVEDNSYVYVT